jgi:hypothetical protein
MGTAHIRRLSAVAELGRMAPNCAGSRGPVERCRSCLPGESREDTRRRNKMPSQREVPNSAPRLLAILATSELQGEAF